MHTTHRPTSHPVTRPGIRTAIRIAVAVALFAGTLAAAPTALAATDVEGSATVQFQGRLLDVAATEDGACEYHSLVKLRGRTDTGRQLRGDRVPMIGTAPCDHSFAAGDEFRGTGDVEFTGRAGGQKSPIRIQQAAGFGSFGAEGSLLTGPISIGPRTVSFLLEGDLRGRIDKSTTLGAGLCEYLVDGKVSGTSDNGYEVRPARFEEIKVTLTCSPELTEGARVEATISGDATGTSRWIDVISWDLLSFSGEINLRIRGGEGTTHTGFGSFGAETSL